MASGASCTPARSCSARTGYDWDHDIVDDVPPRPGKDWVYLMRKYFGQEICRIFAEHYGLVVPTLTFCQFVEPTTLHGSRIHPLAISWGHGETPRGRSAARSK